MVGGIKLGAGTLYIGHPGDDKLVPLGEAAAGGLLEVVEDHDAYAVDQIITNMQNEASFTVQVSKTQLDNFFFEVFNVKKMVLDMVGGRVAHLGRHGRKRKTRKKNVRRAIRMLEKEERQCTV